MAEAYVGPGVDRITYYGVLYQLCGRYIGEVPDFCMVSQQLSDTDEK